MRHSISILLCLLIGSCTSQQEYQSSLNKTSATQKLMLLDYAGSIVTAQYYQSTAFNFDHTRIGIARVEDGSLMNVAMQDWPLPIVRPGDSTVAPDTLKTIAVVNRAIAQARQTQLAAWNMLAATGTARQVVFIPPPSTSCASYDKASCFKNMLTYIQQISAYNRLDYVVVYESKFISNEQLTGYGNAVSGTIKNAPILTIPVAVAAIAIPAPITTHTNIGCTDAYVIDMRTATFQQYRAFSTTTDNSSSILGWALLNRDHGANYAKITESFEKFFTALSMGFTLQEK